MTELFSHLAYLSLGLSAVQDSLANSPDSKKAKLSLLASMFSSSLLHSLIYLFIPLVSYQPDSFSAQRLISQVDMLLTQSSTASLDTLHNYSVALNQTACQQLFALNISQQLCKQLIACHEAICKILDPKKSAPLACSSTIFKLQPLLALYVLFLLTHHFLLSDKFPFLQITTDNLESELFTSPKKTDNVAEAINMVLA